MATRTDSPRLGATRTKPEKLNPRPSSHLRGSDFLCCVEKSNGLFCVLGAAMKVFEINGSTITLALFVDVTNSKYSFSLYPVSRQWNFGWQWLVREWLPYKIMWARFCFCLFLSSCLILGYLPTVWENASTTLCKKLRRANSSALEFHFHNIMWSLLLNKLISSW